MKFKITEICFILNQISFKKKSLVLKKAATKDSLIVLYKSLIL